MKNTILSFSALFIISSASAQLSVGVSSNYTMYKGDFQKSTPGAQARVSYGFSEKTAGVLSFTYGMPIKSASVATLQDAGGGSTTAKSEIKFNFKTFNLVGHYTFVGDHESTVSMYGVVGAGLVLVSYDEAIKENYDKTAYTPIDLVKGKENGMTINLGLGGSYKLGTPIIFAEAGIALPANQANGQYIENVIPAHFAFNLGLKFNIGGE
jgi:hypothetical protein